jgi:hypothetical protein
MMRILGTGLPLPLWRRAFRKELREEGAPAPKALSPKPERSAETETKAKTKRLEKVKGKRSRPNAADEPPRTWRVPYTVGGESNLPWFVTPL